MEYASCGIIDISRLLLDDVYAPNTCRHIIEYTGNQPDSKYPYVRNTVYDYTSSLHYSIND